MQAKQFGRSQALNERIHARRFFAARSAVDQHRHAVA